MKCGATVQTAPSSQWPRDLSAFAFLHQHDRTTSRQRSSRCNGGDVSTRALERRGNALPHIGKKRSYDGCARPLWLNAALRRGWRVCGAFIYGGCSCGRTAFLPSLSGASLVWGRSLARFFVFVAPRGLTLLLPCCFLLSRILLQRALHPPYSAPLQSFSCDTATWFLTGHRTC
jgi:hypothetical protein